MLREMAPLIESYSATKRALGESVGMGDDLLHVHIGLAVFVLTALMMRRRTRSWWPIGIVTAFAMLNEVIDYLGMGPWSAQMSAMDVVNTVVWPLILFLLAPRGSGVGSKM